METYDIYIICPVRKATSETTETIKNYVIEKEAKGLKVYWPQRDTKQDDATGYNICIANLDAIRKARVVDIFWDTTSTGSCFDLGIAFCLNTPVRLIKIFGEDVTGKSFIKVIKEHEKNSAWQLKGLNL